MTQIMTENQVETLEEAQPTQECGVILNGLENIQDKESIIQKYKKNAFEINLKKGAKLSEANTKWLRDSGCYYSRLHKKYMCPIQIKEKLSGYFEEQKISAKLNEIHDFDVEKPKTIKCIQSRLQRLEDEIHLLYHGNKIKGDPKEYGLLSKVAAWKQDARPEDFLLPPIKEGKLETEYQVELGFHQEAIKLKEMKDEIEELRKSRSRLEKQNEENLPWNGIEIPSGYVLNNNGVWKETIGNTKKEQNEEEATIVKICDPVWVAGRSRDYTGSNSGLIIRWIDLDGITRDTCIERRKLHTSGNLIAEDLAHNNLSIIPGKEKELSRYLSFFTTDKTCRSVKSLGWLESPVGDLLYVSKQHTFKDQTINLQEEIIFQPDTISGGPVPLECNGSIQEWQDNIATPCKGNPVPIFLQSVALSGTIVKYADTGSYGVHLSGNTSRGKTTAAQIAASTTGCSADPSYAPKLSIIKRWLATANALESIASQFTDSVLVLDEIGQCPGSDLDKVIYNLFGGRGKERLNQQGQQKATRDWCTAVISTGEKTLQERLTETNSKSPAGLFVRFIDLHVEEVFTEYHKENSKTFVDRLKRDCGRFYGTAAVAFIQKIVDIYKNSQELREKITIGCISLEKDISGGILLSQEHSRVLKLFCFAALTGIWASEWEIFPYTKEEILESARFLFAKWHKSNQKQTDDIRCICAIQDYFIKKRDSAFRPRYLENNDIRRFSDVFGYTTTEGKFFLTREGLTQALAGLPQKTALKVLHDKGYLLREESPNRNDSRKTIDGINGAPRVYVISEKICEFDRESS